MIGSPGFLASFGHGKALGQCVESLETKFTGNMTFILGKHLFAELLFKILANYPYYFAKSGLDCIIDRIVHDGFTMRSQTIKLLQTSITAAHSCSQEK